MKEKELFITLILLISITCFTGYSLFMLYVEVMVAISNPEVYVETYCPPCVEKVCKKCGDEFNFQNCRYEIMCEHWGYCPAQEKTWKEEYDLCRELRELEEEN